jgi:hypothetical protein
MGFGLNQLIEAKKLASFVQAHANGAVRVGGDFNSSPASPVYRTCRKRWDGSERRSR